MDSKSKKKKSPFLGKKNIQVNGSESLFIPIMKKKREKKKKIIY